MEKKVSEELKKFILSSKSFKISSRFSADDVNEMMDKVLNDLYNSKNLSDKEFSEREIYILKKVLGVFDNGKRQSLTSIGKELGITCERVRQIFYSNLKKILVREINKKNKIRNAVGYLKMTSIDLVSDEKTKNTWLGDIILDDALLNLLNYHQIYSLGGLLSYGIRDLALLLGEKDLLEVIRIIHNLNFKFIEELSLEDKKKIVSCADLEKINISSMCWVTMNDSIYKEINFSKNYESTLKSLFECLESTDFIEMLNNGKTISEVILYNICDIGLESRVDEILSKNKSCLKGYMRLRNHKINRTTITK